MIGDLPTDALQGVDEAFRLVDEPEWDDPAPWPILDEAALYGLAGEIVRTALPETEADAAALLLSLLVAVSNAAGDGCSLRIADDHHSPRLFVAIVGATATGAKGTSWAVIRLFLREAIPDWLSCIKGGFGSGEAIISELGGYWSSEKMNDAGSVPTAAESRETRALVYEPELSRLLAASARDGSTISAVLRGAWDSGTLELRRAKARIVATDAHLSVLAHITPDELRAKLTGLDIAGGFANRFLFVCARRSKKLPSGGHLDDATIAPLVRRLNAAVASARAEPRVMNRTAEADVLWTTLYNAEPDRDGLVGEITARPHPQRLRLAIVFAILDSADAIRPEHLHAAEAVWRYCVASAEHIFRGRQGDDVADRLLNTLRDVWPSGLDGEGQRAIYGRHVAARRIADAREALERRGLASTTRLETGGRPRTVTYALTREERAKSAVSAVNPNAPTLSALSALSAQQHEEWEVTL